MIARDRVYSHVGSALIPFRNANGIVNDFAEVEVLRAIIAAVRCYEKGNGFNKRKPCMCPASKFTNQQKIGSDK